ncbi:HAD-IA family hydrolase [Streptomyces sp. TLI_171]|uniref:HAD-IA family hydrolase n=1 Tax=Streptomyces sp. TLI_171 TaxID=1938859 RepID=UPI000C193C1A|nr:HAD-IA family hydrolase [Streptomyces sp. TLI_171]RKE22085.1 sugar-phosphatase [Streptomyces sp. TLI_171]
MHVRAQAVLFDNDGTLIDSTAAIMRCWRQWSTEFGLPEGVIDLGRTFGRTATAIASEVLPPALLADAVGHYEDLEEADPVCEVLPGAARLLHALPHDRWAIVTSAAFTVALARLTHAALPIGTLVTADDTLRGKPDPEPYLIAARRLGVRPEDCVVFEDAPAGLRAARAAGMTAVGLTTTHRADQLLDADVLVENLDAVEVLTKPAGQGVNLVLRTLRPVAAQLAGRP